MIVQLMPDNYQEELEEDTLVLLFTARKGKAKTRSPNLKNAWEKVASNLRGNLKVAEVVILVHQEIPSIFQVSTSPASYSSPKVTT